MASSAEEQLRRILAQPSDISRLEQLCSALGWGRSLSYAGAKAGWIAEVTCGLGQVHRIETGVHQPKTKKGEKAGRTAAAARAVQALQPIALEAFGRPGVPFADAFGAGALRACEIAEGSPAAWKRLWAILRKQPEDTRAVGIGTAGNSGEQGPPVLVQVAADGLVVVELPRAAGGISPELTKLLADKGVTKVFCDSARQKDARSLGVSPDAKDVVDLERLAVDHFGKPSCSRGLARIAGLVLGVRVDKAGPAGVEAFEGDAESSELADFPEDAVRGAADEAAAALRLWQAFRRALAEQTSLKNGPKVHTAQGGGALNGANEAAKERSSSAKRKGGEGVGGGMSAIDAELAALQAELQALEAAEGSGDEEEEEPPARQPPKRRQRKRSPSSEAPAGKTASASASASASPGGWKGFQKALRAELSSAGGAMHWEALRDALVARRRRKCRKAREGMTEEELGVQALANIPDRYLSATDDLVRLP
eukprot:TRINITY_DN24115_c0_g1_i1.p1 TRINITY_DN24115_c0_g1~~TRINITY_DN24115_c0_g1_i1.p1  ORF type:complete len:502 (-),score=130.57 TRINITY_DN24115_c0_g1_i1:68-1513(-)